MIFKYLTEIEEIKKSFTLMTQLRPHLGELEYIELLNEARRNSSYQLLSLSIDNELVGLMGYRILTDFVHGRHLYIDDLVIAKESRSKGLGARYLKKVKELARQERCLQIRLCTGIDNIRGKKFYNKNNLELRAEVYKQKVTVN
jgi:ribosomal protein S18 acetylase RimI-like enzyme